jgi:hypothetical protein
MDKFDQDVVQQKLRELDAAESANWADYKAFKSNGAAEAAANAAEAAFATQDRRDAFIQRCNQAAAASQPQQTYVSEETRAARGPTELDAHDLAQIMNGSRYSGKSFTAADYNRLRTGLGNYKTLRGIESK